MGASNFYKKNADSYYIIEDSEFIEDDLQYIQDQIIEELDKKCYIYKEDKRNHERNYSGYIFAGITLQQGVKDKETDVELLLIRRSAYYNGCTFDFDLLYDGYEEDIDVIYEKLTKTWQKKLDSIIKNINKVYKKHTQALTKVCTFSNGESVYKPV